MKDQMRYLEKQFEAFYSEDDLNRNFNYQSQLPMDVVECVLKIKSDIVLSGLPFFLKGFQYLYPDWELGSFDYRKFEGKKLEKGTEIKIPELPFAVALTGERISLNLLQRSSAIATFTARFVEKAEKYSVEILDTRKTTPGLRFLEKYSVVQGGGKNHRLGQTDCWMIKDNHKTFFGGVQGAYEYFKSINAFYTPVILEIHDVSEIDQAYELGIKHFLLDNFDREMLEQAVRIKKPGSTYEVSGGITLDNIEPYLVEGIDAVSVGQITYAAPPADISFKYSRKN